jgi:flagellar FliJ protein
VKQFAFRFQRVLEVRRHVEDAKKDQLAALMAQRLEDERKMFAVQGELLDGQRELAGRAEAQETLSNLAGIARYFGKLAGDIARFGEQLEKWDDQIEAKRTELVEAKRDVKVLEQVEQTDRRAYDKALANWEQKLIDEVAAGRYVRGLREEVPR